MSDPSSRDPSFSGRDPSFSGQASSFSGRARRDPDFAAAAALDLEHEPIPSEQVVAGSPMTGSTPLGEFGEHEYGVWEHTIGASTDVEADEVFVVLFGAATVAFEDGTAVELGPGSVGRLHEGQRTVWT
ncbi:MAG TPA: cupin domain-containing protein, partial [Terrimesophilobacter sp.]|nr:cupin domain-containing protein [Terrimesophilobacter sp.]